jgi:hypothetical protein
MVACCTNICVPLCSGKSRQDRDGSGKGLRTCTRWARATMPPLPYRTLRRTRTELLGKASVTTRQRQTHRLATRTQNIRTATCRGGLLSRVSVVGCREDTGNHLDEKRYPYKWLLRLALITTGSRNA